ncbi:MAG: polysaccharide deacetylase 2 family uncharacterized protein YibQ [Alphaproteobacteria bacterium]
MGLILGAAATGVVLGISIAWLFGIGLGDCTGKGTAGQSVDYPGSREASSEFEPPPRTAPRTTPRAQLPKLRVKPGTKLPDTRLPRRVTGAPKIPATVSASINSTSQQNAALTEAAKPQEKLPAWRVHAARVALTPGVPMIGIVIDDLGLDHGRTERAMRLPAPVTLAFLPYGRRLKAETGRARAAGHEILVHVPMEASGAWADPGPNVLTIAMGAAEIRARLDWALARFPGFVGINNHMGSKFTSDAAAMDVVLGELKARGLLFLDSRTTTTTVGFARARTAGVPAATRHVFLDRNLTPQGIVRQLAELEFRARAKGHAIAIGHPHDVTLDALEVWLATLKGKGLQLAPVSALVAGDGAAMVMRGK